MSLYYTQKLLFHLNREPALQERFTRDAGERARLLSEYDLTEEERAALEAGDIGLLYVLGVNGQLLMHHAAFLGLEWHDYIGALREGLRRHGAVRAGIYAMRSGGVT